MDEVKRKREQRPRFLTMLSAKRHARRHKLRVVGVTATPRGDRVDVVTRSGKPRTLRVLNGGDDG